MARSLLHEFVIVLIQAEKVHCQVRSRRRNPTETEVGSADAFWIAIDPIPVRRSKN
jgi:hypothetical protein